MSAVLIEKTKLKWNEAGFPAEAVSVDAAEGGLISMGADQKMLILITNGAAAEATATVKAGDGIQATEDLVITLAASGTAAVSLESGKYLITKGENKGNVLIIGENVMVQAIELP